METAEKEGGSLSSDNVSTANNSEIPQSAGTGSETSTVPAPDSVPVWDNKQALDKPAVIDLNSKAPADAEKPEEPALVGKNHELTKRPHFFHLPPGPLPRLRNVAKPVSSLDMFEAYKKAAKIEAEKSDQRYQGSNLVKGLVDYLRVLEDRIDQLELERKTKLNNINESIPRPAKIDDSEIEITVKFFNAAAYLTPNGGLPRSDAETEKGTFVCCYDTQQLIRVLYSNIKDDETVPLRQADSEPPEADSIDILTFGVSSEAISRFLDKQLNGPSGKDDLIRFGKPFKPLIRHIESFRNQLIKLERKYSRVMTEDANPEILVSSSDETMKATANRDESDFLQSTPKNDHEDDWNAVYNRPLALPQFRMLLNFVDKYLGKQVRLYKRLRQGKEQYVAFENLWMLFDANDTVYCPLSENPMEMGTSISPGSKYIPLPRYTPQAYRVLLTQGGVPHEPTLPLTSKLKRTDETVVSESPATGSSEGANDELEAITEILTRRADISKRVRDYYTELVLYCLYVDFDGVKFGTVIENFTFKPYEREIEIRSLQAYPASYTLQDRLNDNGEKFLHYTKVSHLQYEGLTVGPSREEISSPVVVDVKLAFEGGPDTDKAFIETPRFTWFRSILTTETQTRTYDLYFNPVCSYRWCYNRTCTSDRYRPSEASKDINIATKVKAVLEECETEMKQRKNSIESIRQLMTEHDLIRLLPGVVPGFALRNRRWALLNLTQLQSVEQNNEWDKLILPPGHREIVQAMVETHTQDLGSNNDARVGMDLVQGKGSGCIILLHGVPGVGKTSTAECVAAHTKKPLYPITCGDIGIQPGEVEKNMENHFRLAHRWGCVLLLDEADVFLAKRDQRDVQRNGLVSVFLRMLEYYSGILFLTTNRVGAIDDAFRSRLHLTLYYPKLTKKQTKQIYKQNFQRIGDINIDREKKKLATFDFRDSEPKIMSWAMETWKSQRWNGRQIRNAFQTVLALAEFQTKNRSSESKSFHVTKKHFKIVANASIQFNEYLLATHGMDEDKTAGRETYRAINYNPSSQVTFKANNQSDTDSSTEEEEDSSEGSGDDTASDESDESDARRRKKSSKKRKGKGSKTRSKKKNEKSEKKFKEKRKEKKEKRSDDDDDDDSN